MIHQCDDECVCPLDGKPLLYAPASNQHACQDPACANAHDVALPSPLERRPFPHGFARVQGRCPACRMSALFLGEGGYVTCGNLQCTDPCAATDLLEQP